MGNLLPAWMNLFGEQQFQQWELERGYSGTGSDGGTDLRTHNPPGTKKIFTIPGLQDSVHALGAET